LWDDRCEQLAGSEPSSVSCPRRRRGMKTSRRSNHVAVGQQLDGADVEQFVEDRANRHIDAEVTPTSAETGDPGPGRLVWQAPGLARPGRIGGPAIQAADDVGDSRVLDARGRRPIAIRSRSLRNFLAVDASGSRGDATVTSAA